MSNQREEIDFGLIASKVWARKVFITLVIIATGGASVFYALSLPNIYRAEALVAPTGAEGGGLSPLSQIGGIASLTRLGLGGASTKSDTVMALAVLNSRKFLSSFVAKNELLVPLLASSDWDKKSNKLIIDKKVYNQKKQQWMNGKEKETNIPNKLDGSAALSEILSVSVDSDTGFVRIAIEFYSPTLAAQWVTDIISELNAVMRKKDIEEAKTSIEYLNKQISETSVTEMHSVFYQLVEDQIKKMMLAQVREEYIFQVVDPPIVPDKKAKPSRSLIVIVGVFVGGLFAFGIALLMPAQKKIK